MGFVWLDEYLLSKQGSRKDYKEEWGWDRYLLLDKMFAAICVNKQGKKIITLKCPPEMSIQIREEYEFITEGYYMNKVHWISVYLESDVPEELLKNLVDQSYELILKSFSKKIQNGIVMR